MKIRFTDSDLKNSIFEVIDINKEKKVVRVWNNKSEFNFTIRLDGRSYILFDFDE